MYKSFRNLAEFDAPANSDYVFENAFFDFENLLLLGANKNNIIAQTAPTGPLFADDYAASISTTGVLTIGGSTVSGTFEDSADEDWFRLDVATAGLYQFDLGANFGGGFEVNLYDASGTLISWLELDHSFEQISFASAGTYYLSFRSDFITSYTLALSASSDDYINDTTTTGVLALNGAATTGTVTAADADWLAFDAIAGQTVTFNLDVNGHFGSYIYRLLDVEGASYAFDGTIIAGQSGFHTDTVLSHTFATSGTYYILIEGNNAMSYSVTASDIVDDYAGDTTTTGTIGITDGVFGVAEASGDTDWFAVNLTAGEAINFIINARRFDLRLYDQNGVEVAVGTSPTDTNLDYTSLVGDVSTSGLYYVEVDYNIQSGVFNYALSSSIVGVDAAGDNTTIRTLDVSTNRGVVSETIGFSGDVDWYAITLTENQVVEFSISPHFTEIQVFDASGTAVTGGFFGSVIFDVEASGQYFVQVSADSSVTDRAYILEAVVFGDDYTDNTSTTGTLTVGGSSTGVGNFSGDEDWFAITLTAGDVVRFSGALDQGLDAYFELYDAAGLQVATGASPVLDFSVVTSGQYYISMFANSGPYTIQADVLADDYSDDASTSGALTVDGADVTAALDFDGDEDWFAITLTAGQIVQLSVRSPDMGFMGVRVFDAAGNQLGGGTDDYTFEASSAATYYVSVVTFGNDPTGTYTVSASSGTNLTEGNDNYTGTQSADIIFGLGGNDFIQGLGGADTIFGGDGDDQLVGGAGGDILDGGAGSDWAYYFGSSSQIEINLLAGTSFFGEADGDTLISIENIVGSNFNDVIVGDAGANILAGNSGDDIIDGGAGDDFLIGGQGADTLDGGTGIDWIRAYDLSATQATSIDLSTGVVSNDGYGTADTIANIENISGSTAFTDILTGDAGDNIIYTTGFGDTVNAGAGDDLVSFEAAGIYDGGAGVDTLQAWELVTGGGQRLRHVLDNTGDGRADIELTSNGVHIDFSLGQFVDDGFGNSAAITGFEHLIGSSLNDILVGDAGNNQISGGDGDDILTGGAGADQLSGGDGYDTADYRNAGSGVGVNTASQGTNGEAFQDTYSSIEGIYGSNFNDNIQGSSANEDFYGEGGNDTLNGGAGDDSLFGGAGADRLVGGAGADVNDGGAGLDSMDYRGSSSRVALNLVTGGTVGEALGDTFISIERLYGSNFNDTITGTSANEFLYGEDGNDTINGGGGIDRIYGGDGNDVQRGQGGNDQLYGSAGADQLNGGTGLDIANYRASSAGVGVDMAAGGTGGDADGDTYFGIEAVYGSDFVDTITGNTSSNELRGFDGDDTLDGGSGNDRLFGGNGADTFIGGAGIDIAMFTVATAGVTLDLATGGTGGEAAGDTYSSIEWVFGSGFDDNITGDDGINRLTGNDGNDTLNGAGGNDRLLGGDGNDTINGGDGVDTIFGQDGDDILSGGAGNDFFFGDTGSDSHDGGTGTDTVSYLASSVGVTLNMQTGGTGGDAVGDSYVSIERIFGTGQDDSITGSNGNDTLLGNGGADYLAGGLGNDSLNGGAGVDSFGYDTASDDGDVINGFTTNETIYILGGDTNFDTFAELMAAASNAGANTVINFGGGNTLTIVGHNMAALSASNFDFSGTPPAGEAPSVSKLLVSEDLGIISDIADEPIIDQDLVAAFMEQYSEKAPTYYVDGNGMLSMAAEGDAYSDFAEIFDVI